MEDLLKEIKIGNSIVYYYTKHIEVEIGVTDTSTLDCITFSYKMCNCLSPFEIVDKAWQDHDNAVRGLYEEGYYEEYPTHLTSLDNRTF